MKLIAFCIIAVLCIVLRPLACKAASAATVGLYAPDRYDGIPDMCLMPMDFGYCKAKVKRFYFDMRRMKCNTFYWGGCAGNINNFKSLEECNKICLDAYEDSDNSYQQRAQPQKPQTQQQPQRPLKRTEESPTPSAPTYRSFNNRASATVATATTKSVAKNINLNDSNGSGSYQYPSYKPSIYKAPISNKSNQTPTPTSINRSVKNSPQVQAEEEEELDEEDYEDEPQQ